MVGTVQSRHPDVRHAPLLHHPWFSDSSEGVSLHRYFDDQFVQRFTQEAHSGRLSATRSQDWYNSDRFGRKDLPTLRLPMHQTFYVACCEVSCDNPGRPAFDPRRIRSAGFVIRRRAVQGEVQRWMLHEGQPLGWQNGLSTEQEPEDYRRFVHSKLLPPQFPEPAYSGEETYPMHPLLVRSKDVNGRQRSRTLLWGYLPLGGSYRSSSASAPPPAAATGALRRELRWPFGERTARSWTPADSRPIFQGCASQAFYELLELLLLRYRVFAADDDDNHALRVQLAAIHFYPSLLPQPLVPFDPYATPAADSRGESLLQWLEGSRDALLEWCSLIGSGAATLANPLPRQTGADADGAPLSTARHDDLYLTEQQAATLRDALLARGGRAMQAQEEGLALPRFAQSGDDRFFIVPFVRWQDECGCERIHWGEQASIDFGVVSPFDPEAQRPRAIILPGLDDIRRGTARGVTVMAPKSLANLLRKIKPTMDLGSGGPGNPSGLCWNFSLSIPVITICAFILLMVIMNLLNLIFRWLPWAFLAVPRLCGKLLREDT